MKSTQRLQSTQTPSNTTTGVASAIDDLQPAAIRHQGTDQRHSHVDLERIAPVAGTAARQHLTAYPAREWNAEQAGAAKLPVDGVAVAVQVKQECQGAKPLSQMAARGIEDRAHDRAGKIALPGFTASIAFDAEFKLTPCSWGGQSDEAAQHACRDVRGAAHVGLAASAQGWSVAVHPADGFIERIPLAAEQHGEQGGGHPKMIRCQAGRGKAGKTKPAWWRAL